MAAKLGLLKASDARRISAAEMKYMRRTAGYTWTDYKTNAQIAKEVFFFTSTWIKTSFLPSCALYLPLLFLRNCLIVITLRTVKNICRYCW